LGCCLGSKKKYDFYLKAKERLFYHTDFVKMNEKLFEVDIIKYLLLGSDMLKLFKLFGRPFINVEDPDEECEKGWYSRQLPIGCGPFKTIREGCVLDTTDTFSHIVQAVPTMRKNHYLIYPHVGEIWALYKNWSLEWSFSDLEDCEFDLVEILAVSSSGFKAMMLSKVTGYRAVFMGERIEGSTKTIDIPFAERWKFSYKIPAFKLTEERGGKLRGYWELDPASVPDVMLFTDSN